MVKCSCSSWLWVLREFLAEFMGTFILVAFGLGAAAQSVLSFQDKGDFLSVNLGWCIGMILGTVVSIGVSGAHLNPAITVALVLARKHPVMKVFHYLAAQYLGAFASSAVVLLVYWDALLYYETDRGEYRATPGTAQIFSSYPAPHTSNIRGFLDQVVATALLSACYCAITDKQNRQVAAQGVPLYLGLTILGLGVAFGLNCGYPVNPARDLAPRILTAVTGWGWEVFNFHQTWFLVPIFAPHVGAVVGAGFYYLFIEIPRNKEES